MRPWLVIIEVNMTDSSLNTECTGTADSCVVCGLYLSVQEQCCRPGGWCPAGPAPAETSGCRQRTLTYTSPSHCPGTAATSGHSTTRRTPPSGCTLDTGQSSLTGKHLTFKEKYQKKFTNRCNTSFTCLSKMLSHFQCSNVHS